MTEPEKLQRAQDFIDQELRRRAVERIDALTWEQTPQDRVTRIHRLVVFRDGEKSIFTFTEYELIDNYGSKKWEKQLRSHVGDVLMEI
jgi:hypothetical protein